MDSKTKFLYDDGGVVRIIKINNENFRDDLRPGVYSIHFQEMMGFYLKTERDGFSVPAKLYGNVEERANKIIQTYQDRTGNTGILMTGTKGSGKTLLGQVLGNKMINELKIPVILVQQQFAGGGFNSFIEQLGEVVLVFDEFGKMYPSNHHDDDGEAQDGLLTLLDGFSRQKRMFILTENEVMKINSFLLDRPSRIYYHFQYDKLDEDSTNDYCVDKNIDPEVTKVIIEISRQMDEFNFDILQTIIEECDRYQATPDTIEDLLVDLNINYRKDQPMLVQITKVIHEESDTECQLTIQSRTTQKYYPHSYNDYLYCSFKRLDGNTDNDSNTTSALVTALESTDECVPTPQKKKGDGIVNIHFDRDHMEYETPTTMIFKKHGYAIVVAILASDPFGAKDAYAKYLAF